MSIRKKINLLFLLGVFTFIGCKKEEENSNSNNSGSTAPIRGIGILSHITSGDRVMMSFGSFYTFLSSGICWSDTESPTVDDNIYEFGPLNGGFHSVTITGLTPLKTYYMRAYGTDNEGTIYSAQISFTVEGVALGQSFGGGIVCYILQPDDPGYEPNVMHGLIAQLTDFQSQIDWGCEGTLTGASETAIGTGFSNSVLSNLSCFNPTVFIQYPADIINYSDWYLPSKDELYMMYLNRNVIPNLQGGMNPLGNYWSSSEVDANRAWTVNFSIGSVYQNSKNTGNPSNVRLIRSF